MLHFFGAAHSIADEVRTPDSSQCRLRMYTLGRVTPRAPRVLGVATQRTSYPRYIVMRSYRHLCLV